MYLIFAGANENDSKLLSRLDLMFFFPKENKIKAVTGLG